MSVGKNPSSPPKMESEGTVKSCFFQLFQFVTIIIIFIISIIILQFNNEQN